VVDVREVGQRSAPGFDYDTWPYTADRTFTAQVYRY
jgi:hypothetical protein